MVILKRNEVKDGLMLPTSISEISNDYFAECLSEVEVAKDNVVIALIYKEKLSYILQAAKNPNNVKNSIVIPVIAKIREDQKETIKEHCGAEIGNRAMISSVDLGRGLHINSNSNMIDINKVIEFINSDKVLQTRCLTGAIYKTEEELKANKIVESPYHYFVEFKLVPFCDIKGVYKNAKKSCRFYVNESSDKSSDKSE